MKFNKDGTPNKKSLALEERMAAAEAVVNQFFNDDRYVLLRKSMVAGQLSRMNGAVVSEYNGNYGTGVTVDVPYYGKGSKFFTRYYFIFKGEDFYEE